jgi:hypothetical protein
MLSRLLVAAFISAVSAFASSASTFSRESSSWNRTAGAAGPQTSRGPVTVEATNSARTDDVQARGSRLKVKWESGKLSLDAEAVPLSEVLLGVSRATEIEITGAEGLNNLVSMHLAKVELFQTLRDLLLHFDYAITMGSKGSVSPRGTRVIIVGRSSPGLSLAGSVAERETNAPTADGAIQAADHTPADTDPQASKLASNHAGESGEDRAAVTQAQQQPAHHLAETDQQSLNATAPSELTGPDNSVDAGEAQPATQNADAVGLEASSKDLPGTDPQLADSQTKKLAAVEAAASSEDREALSKYMQDPNAAVQAAAFDALAANDNPAAVANFLSQINDPSQPGRLQALQLLSQSPQADEQTVLTTLIDALNGTDTSLSAHAAQALAERGTAEAMNALSEMFNSSDPSTRLMILQSVANTEAGQPLLRAALSDSNETVRSAAAALVQQGEATENP